MSLALLSAFVSVLYMPSWELKKKYICKPMAPPTQHISTFCAPVSEGFQIRVIGCSIILGLMWLFLLHYTLTSNFFIRKGWLSRWGSRGPWFFLSNYICQRLLKSILKFNHKRKKKACLLLGPLFLAVYSGWSVVELIILLILIKAGY